jgi:hypothetical protein
MWLEMRKGWPGSIRAEVIGARRPWPKLRRSGNGCALREMICRRPTPSATIIPSSLCSSRIPQSCKLADPQRWLRTADLDQGLQCFLSRVLHDLQICDSIDRAEDRNPCLSWVTVHKCQVVAVGALDQSKCIPTAVPHLILAMSAKVEVKSQSSVRVATSAIFQLHGYCTREETRGNR